MQHPMFAPFAPWKGESDGRFHIDFLGVKTDPKFYHEIKPTPAGEVEGALPKFGPQFYEWIATLGAARNAREKFVMVELGAGYGPWLVRGAAAVRRHQDIPIQLIGVEPHALHHQWMQEHFANNGLDPAQHTLLHGLVTPKPGNFDFLETAADKPSYDSKILSSIAGRLFGGGRVSKLRGYSLNELLADCEYVDLLHMDIQGAELDVIKASLDVLAKKVRVMCIGTHSKEIDEGLVKTLTDAQWLPRWVYPRQTKWATMWGIIQFADGCHVWLNSRLLRKLS